MAEFDQLWNLAILHFHDR